MWKAMQEFSPSVFVDSTEQGIELVKEGQSTRYVAGQGRRVRVLAGVENARVHHSAVVRSDAGRRTSRQ